MGVYYRTSRSFGCGYESVTELPEVPGIVARAYKTCRSSFRIQKVLYSYPGIVARGVVNSQKFRVRVLISYRTNISLGTGMKFLQNFRMFRVLCYGRTQLTEAPGAGMNVLQSLQEYLVRVLPG